MIIQDFTLHGYEWYVRVFYSIKGYNLDIIEESLKALDTDEEELENVLDSLREGRENIGFTFTNVFLRESIIIIGPTSSPEEFQDTFDHEKGHLAMHICLAYDIDPFGEEFQYLVGNIGKQMFKVGKRFLCDHCHPNMQ